MFKTYTPIPMQISGLVMWLDAANSSSITQSGGLVSQWSDLSGQQNNATQATGSLQPTTNATKQNGNNVVDFSGTRYMQFANNNFFDSSFTAFVVAKTSTISSRGTFISRQQGSTAGGFNIRNNGDSTNFTAFAVGTGSTFSTVNISPSNTNFNVHTAWFSNFTSYNVNNGTTSTAGTITYDNANTSTPLLGAAASPAVEILTGSIAEVIIYNSILSSSNRTSICRYLGTKWGITVS